MRLLLLVWGICAELLSAALDLSRSSEVAANQAALPRNGTVAIILRGEVFRSDVDEVVSACDPRAMDTQRTLTHSFVDQVVVPLEKRGNNVDVFIAINHCESDDLYNEIINIIGERIVFISLTHEVHQGGSMQAALGNFAEVAGDVSATYGLVMVARHDLLWKTPIDAWDTDFSRLNFASFCEMGRLDPCMNDIIQIMPGKFFNSFHDQVGSGTCFNDDVYVGTGWCGSGHFCRSQMEDSLGKENVGVAWDWVPKQTVREENNFAYIDRRGILRRNLTEDERASVKDPRPRV